MKVVFGCDPNATQFKLDLMEYVKSLGHEVADLCEYSHRSSKSCSC